MCGIDTNIQKRGLSHSVPVQYYPFLKYCVPTTSYLIISKAASKQGSEDFVYLVFKKTRKVISLS